MKVSCDVSCVQLAMRHCHNAENGGNNRDGGSKQCAFPGRIRRSPRNERGFVAGSLSAVCARGHLRRGRRVEEFWKFLGRMRTPWEDLTRGEGWDGTKRGVVVRWTTAEPARYRRVRFGSRAWRELRAPRFAFRQTSFRCRIPSTQSY